MSARDELATVLRQHKYDSVRAVCSCSDEVQVGLKCDDETHEQHAATVLLAAGYSKPRTITTVEELDAAIVRSFEQGENLVLLSTWRPWIVWEDDRGDVCVSSLPVEDDPDRLSLGDITLPATVLYTPKES